MPPPSTPPPLETVNLQIAQVVPGCNGVGDAYDADACDAALEDKGNEMLETMMNFTDTAPTVKTRQRFNDLRSDTKEKIKAVFRRLFPELFGARRRAQEVEIEFVESLGKGHSPKRRRAEAVASELTFNETFRTILCVDLEVNVKANISRDANGRPNIDFAKFKTVRPLSLPTRTVDSQSVSSWEIWAPLKI